MGNWTVKDHLESNPNPNPYPNPNPNPNPDHNLQVKDDVFSFLAVDGAVHNVSVRHRLVHPARRPRIILTLTPTLTPTLTLTL